MTLTAASRRPAAAGKRRGTAISPEAGPESNSGPGTLTNDSPVAARTHVAAIQGRRRSVVVCVGYPATRGTITSGACATTPKARSCRSPRSCCRLRWTLPEPGRYLRRQDLSDAWRVACTAIGLMSWSKDHPEGIRPHDLRHHAATTTARIPGVTTKELMARLGHSSPRTVLIYQHATEERDRAIADQLDTLIDSTQREPRAKVVNLELRK
ncbi:MAG: site-specific integrase [Acidimicrobiales bacterium]